MINKEELKKIKKLHIKTSLMVGSLMSGQYRSVFRGTGMEFEEVRDYRPGDDVRKIDWKVSARIGKPYIKVYREEREVSVMIMIDMSSSGLFGTNKSTKIEKAAELAAVAAYTAVKNNDKAGLILFTDKIDCYIPPGKGPSHVWRLIKEIYTFEKTKGLKTDISAALEYFGKVSRKRTVCILISDFISPPFEKELKKLKRINEIIAVQIRDRNDFNLPAKGAAYFSDPETGKNYIFDSGSEKIKKRFKKKGFEFEVLLNNFFKKNNIDFLKLYTDQSSADFLINYFRYRHKRVQKANG
ncbi:MAG: DUF58 domain-containing protein [Thermodesulfobacteriota bacterium]